MILNVFLSLALDLNSVSREQTMLIWTLESVSVSLEERIVISYQSLLYYYQKTNVEHLAL